MVKLAIWLVNAQLLQKAGVMMGSVSIVGKKGGHVVSDLESMLTHSIVTLKPLVPIPACSRAPAEYVRMKATLLPNVQTSLRPSASTASKKVNYPYRRRACLNVTLSLGHQTLDCTANRVFDNSHVADMSAEDAWAALQTADKECDLDDFRQVRVDKICLNAWEAKFL